MDLDRLSVERILEVMSQQDARAVQAVAAVRPAIVRAVEIVVEAFQRGGALWYVGAGTSGRLGVLDAAECPPTFSTNPKMVQAIMAGDAIVKAVEGAEDDEQAGISAIDSRGIEPPDVVMGIATGGTTPYVIGALNRAIEKGVRSVFFTCVEPFEGEPKVDVVIRPLTGPEALTGSTRLKAGTATKLVLNMITTAAMVRLGKAYENLMVDLRATNSKLWDRGARIISTITNLPRPAALELLNRADGQVKLALVMHLRNVDKAAGQALLATAGGHLRAATELKHAEH